MSRLRSINDPCESHTQAEKKQDSDEHMTDTMLLVVSVVLVAVSLPLILRRIPPNRWYGFRVSATFADECVWYEANAKSGRDLLRLGLIQILLALELPVVRELPKWASATILVAGVLIIAEGGWLRTNRLLRERERTGPLR